MSPAALRRLLLLIVIVLTGLGLTMIASTTVLGAAAGRSDGSVTYAFVLRQLLALAIGAAGAAAIAVLGTAWLRRGWAALAIAVAAALGLVAVLLVGRTVNGARRWLDIGPVNVQPAEFAKLALVVFAAWWLAAAGERVRTVRWGLLPPAAAFLALAGLVYLTKDLGSVAVMGLALGALLIVAGAPWLRLLAVVASALPLAAYFSVWQVGYRRERFLAFLDPWQAEGPAGYHLQQSFIAIGSGGLAGVGLGQGSASLAFLPERHTDFIYAVICEELGMLGGLMVALAFLAFAACGLAIAQQARDAHQRLLAVGATVLIASQAFWNMLVVVGAVPTKGLTLPFISYGGSSLIVCLLLVGILAACAGASAREARSTVATRPIGATTALGRHPLARAA